MSTTAASPRPRRRSCWSIAARPRCSVRAGRHRRDLAGRAAGEATSYLHDETKYPAAATLQLPAEQQGNLDLLLQLSGSASGKLVPIRELVTVSDLCANSRSTTRTCCR